MLKTALPPASSPDANPIERDTSDRHDSGRSHFVTSVANLPYAPDGPSELASVPHSAAHKRAAVMCPGRKALYLVNCVSRGRLHRAIVSLPDRMCADESYSERIVFFEAPYDTFTSTHDAVGDRLVDILKRTWCADDVDWANDGLIYNVNSAHDILCGTEGLGPESGGLLNLFAIGCGGPGGIGPEHTHYARADRVDLLVSPKVAALMREQLATVEALYGAAAREAQQ